MNEEEVGHDDGGCRPPAALVDRHVRRRSTTAPASAMTTAAA